MLLLVAAALALVFWNGLRPGHVMFSNDGPLGALKAAPLALPALFTGGWFDLNTLGVQVGTSLHISSGLQWLLGPVLFSKFYAPLSLLLMGLAVWTFLKQLGLNPVVCLLGALAAALNTDFLSTASWGMAPHTLGIALSYLALAALVDVRGRFGFLRLAVGGMGVGMAVMEGADLGAIFSVHIAAFVLYQALAVGRRPSAREWVGGLARLGVVIAFAGFLASQTVWMLVSTQIQGVAGTQQDAESKAKRWDFATQWSLPKAEALSFVVPGLYGYRMDTPQNLPKAIQGGFVGGNYWGAIGRDPNWDRFFEAGQQGQPPGGYMRFSGSGVYTGVLVVLVAFYAVFQSLRKKDSIYSLETKRWIWFWSGVALVGLLLSFGRFAPFYQLLYLLPYFSTIRNPIKFAHVVNWALIILFAYGAQGLWKRHIENSLTPADRWLDGLQAWWRQVRGFDRRWTIGTVGLVACSLLGLLMFSASKPKFISHLQQVQFDAALADAIARFSLGQVMWAVAFLAAAVVLVIYVLGGRFGGKRAKWAGWAFALFIVVDLTRANLPWVTAWDYQHKYASNPVLDRLRERAFEQRTAILPGWVAEALRAPSELGILDQLYRIEWAQHHFYYYSIPSLDIVQLPRMPEDLLAFETALQPKSFAEVWPLVARRWELTSTRYLLGPADFLGFLNQQLDRGKERFQVKERFSIAPKPGVLNPTRLEDLTAVPSTNGPFALLEFKGALPRARLYNHWQIETNGQDVLKQLQNPAFDPATNVIVTATNFPSPSSAAPADPGPVSITDYSPKRIVLKAEPNAPSILLMTDRTDAHWHVEVDGKPQPVLRCNYLMRGVYLPAGSHEVVFRFAPPLTFFYVSLAAVCLGILLTALLVTLSVVRNSGGKADSADSPAP